MLTTKISKFLFSHHTSLIVFIVVVWWLLGVSKFSSGMAAVAQIFESISLFCRGNKFVRLRKLNNLVKTCELYPY